MSNRLLMETIRFVETRHRSGHFNRESDRGLKLNHSTVDKDVRRLQAAARRDAGDPAGKPHTANGGQNRPNTAQNATRVGGGFRTTGERRSQ